MPNVNTKSLLCIPKCKWDGDEEHAINNGYKIDDRYF